MNTTLALRGSTPQVLADRTALTERDTLVKRLVALRTVTTDNQLAQATDLLREAKGLAKQVESDRKAVKAPVTKLAKQIDAVADDFQSPLTAAVDALQGLVTTYVDQQRKLREEAERRAAEEAARIEQEREAAARAAEARLQTELARAKSEQAQARAQERFEQRLDAAGSAAAEAYGQLPTVRPIAKPSGLVERNDPCFEVVDERMAFAARPEFFRLVPQPLVIKSAMRGGLREVPGLRLWWETSTTVKAS